MEIKQYPKGAGETVYVVGAGIMGLCSAYYLADAGFEVVIMDRNPATQEASWAGGGIISALCPWRCHAQAQAFIQASQALYPGLVAELIDRTGIDPELSHLGMAFLDEKEWRQGVQWCEAQGVKFRLTARSLVLPEIQAIRNPRLVKALRKHLQALGVRFLHQEVLSLKTKQGRLCALLTNEGEYQVSKAIICTGAFGNALFKSLGIELKVQPIKGQMLAFKMAPGRIKEILYKDGHYLIPRKDGLVLVGSTLEDVGFDRSLTEAGREKLQRFAVSRLPELAGRAPDFHWSGLRPRLQGGPLVGPANGVQGLMLNLGHYRNGLASAPGAAKHLIQCLSDDRIPADCQMQVN